MSQTLFSQAAWSTVHIWPFESKAFDDMTHRHLREGKAAEAWQGRGRCRAKGTTEGDEEKAPGAASRHGARGTLCTVKHPAHRGAHCKRGGTCGCYGWRSSLGRHSTAVQQGKLAGLT